MNKVSYKGYAIDPAPMPLADGGWNHEVYVVRDRGHGIVQRKFSSSATFATREEAIAHCVAFGRKIIDGEVPNCSVGDL